MVAVGIALVVVAGGGAKLAGSSKGRMC